MLKPVAGNLARSQSGYLRSTTTGEKKTGAEQSACVIVKLPWEKLDTTTGALENYKIYQKYH